MELPSFLPQKMKVTDSSHKPANKGKEGYFIRLAKIFCLETLRF